MKFNQKNDSVIKAFGVYIPPFRVDTDSLSKTLGASHEDIAALKGIIGNHETIAIADMAYMDTVVLALDAVEDMRRASEKSGVATDYNQVQMIFGGTECPPDKSKPTMALEIQKFFGISPNAGVMHNAAACNVGSGMLLTARDFVSQRSGIEAVVAMADIARYNPEDYRAYKKSVTPGAGGAAFLLGNVDLENEEWLIQLCKPGLEGLYSKGVQDFWFPDGAQYPDVNGLLSCWCYHLGVLGAVSDHFKKLDKIEGKKSFEERLSEYTMIVPHIPFINQARDAFCLLHSGEPDKKIETLEQAISQEVRNPKDKDNRTVIERMISSARTNEAIERFNDLTKYWKDLPVQIGNPYSVSLPASLVYGLQQIGLQQKNEDEPFEVLLAFFGSGFQATAMSARVHPFATEYAKSIDLVNSVKSIETIPPDKYLRNIRPENAEPFSLPRQGYFMRTGTERGYPSYSRV